MLPRGKKHQTKKINKMKTRLSFWNGNALAIVVIGLTSLALYGFNTKCLMVFVPVFLIFMFFHWLIREINTVKKRKERWVNSLDAFVFKTHSQLRTKPKIMVTKDFSFGKIYTPYSHDDEYASIRKKHPAVEYITKKVILPYVGMSVAKFTELIKDDEITIKQQELIVEIGTLDSIVDLAKYMKKEMPENLFNLMMKRYPAFVLLFKLNEKQIEKAIETLSIINLLGKRDSPFYSLEEGEWFIAKNEYGVNYCLYGAIGESHIIENKNGRTIWHVIKELEEREEKPFKHLRKQVKEKFALQGQNITI